MSFEENKHDLTPDDLNVNQWEVLPEEMPSTLEDGDSLARKDLIASIDINLSSESFPGPISSLDILGELETTQSETEQTVETENVNHYEENFKAIKKQRGESFAKYLRGNMSEFMDQPNFKDEICRIVPNKRRALQTLKDNHDYIYEALQNLYKDEAEEDLGPPPNPYELVKRAGYELAGPFKRVEEVEKYRDDFREGERLCTFNDVGNRLNAYNILWLRHQNYDQILPADKLTQENLSEEWKQYLRERNLYDKETGLYDIDNIKPAREDPYGTSSMSVQISKTGSHVSIKNHYNHKVSNPDSTLGNKLDNVVARLEKSVFHEVGREDLVDAPSVELVPGYVVDNDGGLHPYTSEENNIYNGYYERIENGEAEIIPEDKYHQIRNNMYIRRGNIVKNIHKAQDMGQDYESHIENFDRSRSSKIEFFNNSDETRRVTYYDNGRKIADYDYGVGEDGNINQSRLYAYDAYSLGGWSNIDELTFANGPNLFAFNTAAKSLILENGDPRASFDRQLCAVSVVNNEKLKSLEIGDNRQVYKMLNNDSLESIKIGENSAVEMASLDLGPSLVNIELAKGSSLDNIRDVHPWGWLAITVPEHSTIKFIKSDQSLFCAFGSEVERAANRGANVSMNLYRVIDALSRGANFKIIVKGDDNEQYLRIINDEFQGLRVVEYGESQEIDSSGLV